MADGASEEEKGFIDFVDHGAWGDLEFSGASLRERIFVGRRGSGKSRYLRAQERAARKKMLVFEQQADTISLVHVRKVQKEYSDSAEREEAWIGLWRAAVLLALGSFLANSNAYDRSALSEKQLNDLTDILAQHLGTASVPFSVVAALNQLLNATEGRRSKIDERLPSPDWVVLEYCVSQLVPTVRPIGLFIDSLDDNFRYAPVEHTQVQISFLLYISRLLTDPARSNRLHIFVTVRDIIYSKFLQHEQSERYVNETHWKLLDWRKSAARYFFEQKISKLPTRYLAKPHEKDPFVRWLGVDKVKNPVRGIDEEVGDFLLRHTRFLPREVVEIGNALCHATTSRRETPGAINIWSLVIKQAEGIGARAVQVVYDHIVSLAEQSFPSDTARQQYRAMLGDAFDKFMAEIPSEVFTPEVLERADLAFSEASGDGDLGPRFSTLLWQHGLIGYLYSDETHAGREVALFFHAMGGTEGNADFELPKSKEYRLHAALVDSSKIKLSAAPPKVETTEIIDPARRP